MPDTRPVAKPLSTRPANSHGVPEAAANTMALTIAIPIAGMLTLRRPIWSDNRPKNSSAIRFPSTYTA